MKNVQILAPNGMPARQQMSTWQGAGAGFGGQLERWNPQLKSFDAALLPNLKLGNARAEDVTRNNAFAANGVQLHIDNIVGHLFRLSYKPRWRRLGISDADARAFAEDVEAWWFEYAEDPTGCWLDVERKRTATMMVREAIGTHTRLGEITAAAEWVERRGTPMRTAVRMVSPKRVCNPGDRADSGSLRAGIEFDRYGAAVAYWVRQLSTGGLGLGTGYGSEWRRVDREAANGRVKFIHVYEPTEDGQARGANQFLTVLEQSHMLPKLQHTKLQNAIVNAMYAATIESELGTEAAMEVIGAGEEGVANLSKYMMAVNSFNSGSKLTLNGVKIPHLWPGEKLNLQTSANVDNGFTDLESSILRWMAAGLNVPYEPFARDYRQSTYSSARASMMEGWRYYMGRRKVIAARFATQLFVLAFEEALQRRLLSLPRNAARGFYEARSAWCNCDWIGAGRLAIDGLKEVKEAVLRIESGLSTYEKELALLGEDYQETFAQQVREMDERRTAGLPPPSWMRTQALAPDQAEPNP
ncbi:phage portal protein [Stutzerimonas nosocomialis]|uniref:Phage portal protein n=1 Tax=Stutzerimonas nosocomialis TaxID=1056496 RepID=A0A5R9QIL7_9GAMM|nr:phage portal protein [Stutzerimonas nosocomialis]TLX65079.1 phage portal protein [Stutzerimonas nosocomialis]